MLSRRRRVKRTRLRKEGSITLGEGQDLQDQNEVDGQIKQETRQNSGRKPRTETRARVCDNCGEAGHNVRTCQVVSSTSEEEDSE